MSDDYETVPTTESDESARCGCSDATMRIDDGDGDDDESSLLKSDSVEFKLSAPENVEFSIEEPESIEFTHEAIDCEEIEFQFTTAHGVKNDDD